MMVKYGMSDKQVEDINNLIQNCQFVALEVVCNQVQLPCARVIDKGQCPVILAYLDEQIKEVENNEP